MNLGTLAARAGAVSYTLWGLLHLYAAWISFNLGEGLEDAFIVSKLQQNGWNLAFISLACIFVAVRLNWRNSRIGFWWNLIMVSITDMGFVVLVLWPGISQDLLGPILWILGAILTGIGQLRGKTTL